MGIVILCIEDLDLDLTAPIIDGLRDRFGGAPLTTILINNIKPLGGGTTGRVIRANVNATTFEEDMDHLMNDLLDIPKPDANPEGGHA